MSLKGERALLVEAFGAALGEYGNDVIAEVETMIAQAIDQTRNEIRAEFAEQMSSPDVVGLLFRLNAAFTKSLSSS
jgi:hypothetical protein